jgi:tRNA-dihydrouridine synthase C
MAKSAVIGTSSGALGIDLNFGCPAKTVNRRDGGSVLLQYPRRIESIVDAVRQSVDSAIPVCAKIRLGFDSADLLPEIVGRIAAAGANELCIHARTRLDGYKPPAHWQHISGIQRPEKMELIVNGEIWSAMDALEAQHQSACKSLMLGRGALARPDLARIIRSHLEAGDEQDWQSFSWPEVATWVERFFNQQDSGNHRYIGNRTKQWLGYLRKNYVGAEQLFHQIKKLKDRNEIATMIKRHRSQIEKMSSLSFAHSLDPTKSFEELSIHTYSQRSGKMVGIPSTA